MTFTIETNEVLELNSDSSLWGNLTSAFLLVNLTNLSTTKQISNIDAIMSWSKNFSGYLQPQSSSKSACIGGAGWCLKYSYWGYLYWGYFCGSSLYWKCFYQLDLYLYRGYWGWSDYWFFGVVLVENADWLLKLVQPKQAQVFFF